MIEVPHIALPFRLSGDRIAAVEQDSNEEIAQNAETIIRYPTQYRLEAPDFGVSEGLFRQEGVDPDEIKAAISEFEPRAEAEVEDLELPEDREQAIQRVRVAIGKVA